MAAVTPDTAAKAEAVLFVVAGVNELTLSSATYVMEPGGSAFFPAPGPLVAAQPQGKQRQILLDPQILWARGGDRHARGDCHQ